MNIEAGQAMMGNPALGVAGRQQDWRRSVLNDGRSIVHLSLLFEDLPAGIRAKIRLDQIASAMDPTQAELKIWKRSFESLQDREPCEWAMSEGNQTHVLWLAVQGQRDLSQLMSDYVAAWMQAEGKTGSRAAVLSFDPNLDWSLRRDRVLNTMARIEKGSNTPVFVDFGNTPAAVWSARMEKIACGAVPLE